MKLGAICTLLAATASAAQAADLAPNHQHFHESDPCHILKKNQCKSESLCVWTQKPNNPRLSRKDSANKFYGSHTGEENQGSCASYHLIDKVKWEPEKKAALLAKFGEHADWENIECRDAHFAKDCKDINQHEMKVAGSGNKCMFTCDSGCVDYDTSAETQYEEFCGQKLNDASMWVQEGAQNIIDRATSSCPNIATAGETDECDICGGLVWNPAGGKPLSENVIAFSGNEDNPSGCSDGGDTDAQKAGTMPYYKDSFKTPLKLSGEMRYTDQCFSNFVFVANKKDIPNVLGEKGDSSNKDSDWPGLTPKNLKYGGPYTDCSGMGLLSFHIGEDGLQANAESDNVQPGDNNNGRSTDYAHTGGFDEQMDSPEQDVTLWYKFDMVIPAEGDITIKWHEPTNTDGSAVTFYDKIIHSGFDDMSVENPFDSGEEVWVGMRPDDRVNSFTNGASLRASIEKYRWNQIGGVNGNRDATIDYFSDYDGDENNDNIGSVFRNLKVSSASS